MTNLGANVLSTGLGLLFIGGGLFVLTRSRLFTYGIEARKAMIESAKNSGEIERVRKLTHEISVLQKRVPLYAKLVGGLGLLLIALGIFL
jgi:hypothetical protein